jgi:hypothetical protein
MHIQGFCENSLQVTGKAAAANPESIRLDKNITRAQAFSCLMLGAVPSGC